MILTIAEDIVTDDNIETKMCKNCYATNEGYRLFCINCGERL